MGELFKKKLTATVVTSAEVGRRIGQGHTGRWISDDDARKRAQEWGEVASKDDLLSHTAADRFRVELESLKPIAGNNLPCVRGRTREVTELEIDSWLNMGPEDPPKHENRYNEIGVIALYLCDCERGVRREVKWRSDPRLFLQQYEIPLNALRLADFSSADLNNFARAVFEVAENCFVEGRAGRSDYIFSQAVGQLVREAGFEGMLVPGVRGDQDFKYRNVVIFDKHEQWRTWSRQDAGFRHVLATDGAE